MIEDFLVPARTAKQIEDLALAWRDALGVSDAWAPDMLRSIEVELPRIFSQFCLVVRPDFEMGDAEAYTEFNPPQIAVRESIYKLAQKFDGRARMTFGHELGHLVMHPGAAKLRLESGNKSAQKIKPFESAEWQARKFGAFFLLPAHIVSQFGSFRELAANCQVSLQAAEIRFSEVGHIKKTIPPCVTDLIGSIDAGERTPTKPRLIRPS